MSTWLLTNVILTFGLIVANEYFARYNELWVIYALGGYASIITLCKVFFGTIEHFNYYCCKRPKYYYKSKRDTEMNEKEA